MIGAVRIARATIRSFRIYYGDRRRAAAMDRLYGNFVRPGDLVFDVGAHIGDRVASFNSIAPGRGAGATFAAPRKKNAQRRRSR